jgi:hypothetical protein
MFLTDTVKVFSNNEKGATMVEAAIAMPLYMMCILFIPAVIPFMFNMLGAHYASVVSLREVAPGPDENSMVPLEQRLFDTLENNFRIFTTGLTAENATIRIMDVSQGQANASGDDLPAACLRDGRCTIPSGGFVSISTEITFIDFSGIGLPKFSSATLAIKRMSEF